MGQDIRIIFERNISLEQFERLPDRLNAITGQLEPFVVNIGLDKVDKHALWEWGWGEYIDEEFNEWLNSEQVDIGGPFSLYFRIAKNCVLMGCWIRWQFFLADNNTRMNLRKIAEIMNSFFYSSKCLYLPDSNCHIADEILNDMDEGEKFQNILTNYSDSIKKYSTIFTNDPKSLLNEYILVESYNSQDLIYQ